MRKLPILVLLAGCERAGPPVEPPAVIGPDAPAIETIRSTAVANDPPPPAAAPIAPDLVGLRSSTRRWFLALSPVQRHHVRQMCRLRADDPCFGMMPKAHATEPNPLVTLLAELPEDSGMQLDAFCVQANGGAICDTPLVVAFNAQPIEYDTSARQFAFAGTPVTTDWPTAATPWIALDRDGDGAITRGAELFGDSTGNARNGFEALAALDANRDGVIDRRDPAFTTLLLWADANADRRSSPEELRPLADVIVEIPLANHVDARCVRGNCEGERGELTWRDVDGLRTGAIVDVYLRRR